VRKAASALIPIASIALLKAKTALAASLTPALSRREREKRK
jgi:hypothetical protein